MIKLAKGGNVTFQFDGAAFRIASKTADADADADADAGSDDVWAW